MKDPSVDGKCEFGRISYSTRPDGLPIEWEAFKSRHWPGIRAQYRRVGGPVKYDFSVSGHQHCFALLDIYREDGLTCIGEHFRDSKKDLRNKFLYAGPGVRVSGWSRIEKACSLIIVELGGDDPDEIADIPPIFARADTLMKSVLLQFKTLIFEEAHPMTSYAETLGAVLRQELKRVDTKRNRTSSDDWGLTPRQLKVAIAYMDDRIDQDVSVADMARELGMSPFHFIRMFKKSAGVPPHRFFTTRRIDRAKELLRSPHLSISDVAEMSGFGGATQLTRAFRRIVGTNPSSFRRDFF